MYRKIKLPAPQNPMNSSPNPWGLCLYVLEQVLGRPEHYRTVEDLQMVSELGRRFASAIPNEGTGTLTISQGQWEWLRERIVPQQGTLPVAIQAHLSAVLIAFHLAESTDSP